jgi:hypothetical protein
MSISNSDPKQVNARLYNQISLLLDDLEAPPVKKRGKLKPGEDPYEDRISMRERIAALTAIGRIQTILLALREQGSPDERVAGAAVRKYSAAFKDAGGRRKARRGAAAELAAAEPADAEFGDDEPAE